MTFSHFIITMSATFEDAGRCGIRRIVPVESEKPGDV
jgi:hypothetical protein